MTPLVLLVGFLGSGKTTYLRKLLPALQERGLEPHVVINDYQNARVDAELLRGLSDSIVPISGSCVCCGSREELLAALDGFEHLPGRVLVIETNGTTDSEELIELLSLEPSLTRFTPPVQLSVIDGKRWQKRFWHNALELEQARTANYLFLSRLDEINEQRAVVVRQSLEKHGLSAASATPDEFAAELAGIAAENAGIPSRFVAARTCACGDGDHHDHHAHGVHHFASLQLELPPQIARRSLEAFLAALPAEVIRAKGLVRLEESPGEYHVFQKVDQSVQLLPVGASSRFENPIAVLIGPHIPEESVRASAAALFRQPA